MFIFYFLLSLFYLSEAVSVGPQLTLFSAAPVGGGELVLAQVGIGVAVPKRLDGCPALRLNRRNVLLHCYRATGRGVHLVQALKGNANNQAMRFL